MKVFHDLLSVRNGVAGRFVDFISTGWRDEAPIVKPLVDQTALHEPLVDFDVDSAGAVEFLDELGANRFEPLEGVALRDQLSDELIKSMEIVDLNKLLKSHELREEIRWSVAQEDKKLRINVPLILKTLYSKLFNAKQSGLAESASGQTFRVGYETILGSSPHYLYWSIFDQGANYVDDRQNLIASCSERQARADASPLEISSVPWLTSPGEMVFSTSKESNYSSLLVRYCGSKEQVTLTY
jgi:hypothetical protein